MLQGLYKSAAQDPLLSGGPNMLMHLMSLPFLTAADVIVIVLILVDLVARAACGDIANAQKIHMQVVRQIQQQIAAEFFFPPAMLMPATLP